MRNEHHFDELVFPALKSVPFILQSHACKGYLALENLRAHYPQWASEMWQYCVSLMNEDEPKIENLVAPELLDLPFFIDHTSGREFGPDWILKHGLMPLSYWSMRKKIQELGFEQIFQSYLTKALDHPIYLGHELSILSSYWIFYKTVLESHPNKTRFMEFFIQRFTEFVHVTFEGRNNIVFEHPQIQSIPIESKLLEEALRNPGFFGHHVLAFIWTRRLRSVITNTQYQTAMRNLTMLVRWHPDGEKIGNLQPISENVSEKELEERFQIFFNKGPRNVHQITLADALLSVWRNHPEHRGLCLANLAAFTVATRPA